jgi:hypothetical protein
MPAAAQAERERWPRPTGAGPRTAEPTLCRNDGCGRAPAPRSQAEAPSQLREALQQALARAWPPGQHQRPGPLAHELGLEQQEGQAAKVVAVQMAQAAGRAGSRQKDSTNFLCYGEWRPMTEDAQAGGRWIFWLPRPRTLLPRVETGPRTWHEMAGHLPDASRTRRCSPRLSLRKRGDQNRHPGSAIPPVLRL